MGREIRRVPPNWDHPKRDPSRNPHHHAGQQPMFDRTFADAVAAWKREFDVWERGERPDYCTEESRTLEYWEWSGNPPEREYFRPWKDDEATWFQLWETVSEGTPVSPPFATQEELIAHLATHGDGGWGASSPGGWDLEQARRFVMGDAWAPSMGVTGGKLMSGVEFVTRDR